MRVASLSITTVLTMILVAWSTKAQENSPEAAADVAPPADATEAQEALHQELTAMREAIVKSVNEQDVEGLLKHVHPDVVVVWQNAEISRGHKGVRKYYEEKLGGPNAVLKSYTVEPIVEERTSLHGDDAGVAYGTVLCRFEFKNGRRFELNGPWSAMLVRNNGTWQIAGFHASSGLFDNPLLLSARNWLVWGCILAALAGMVIGAVVTSIRKRRK